MKLIFRLFFLILILVACAKIPTQNIDATKNNAKMFNQDIADCQLAYPEQNSGIHYKQWITCMELKGWR